MLALHRAARSGPLASIAAAIRQSVRSRAQLIDDLLDLSRAQTGKLSLNFQEVRCDQLVGRIVDAVRPDALARGIALDLQVGAGEYRLQADPVRIEQIVWNLVSNALKFTPAGGSVNVTLRRDDAMIHIEVADTGHGIRPEYLPVIFEMFQQAGARSTTRGKGGLGIGLAIVKRLVEAHGGHVSAASAGIDRGTTFTVALPTPLPPSASASARVKKLTLRGVRLLLVEDDPDALKVLGMLLEAAGAMAATAAHVDDALAQATTGRFDLIVSDIAMPDVDGYTLLVQLREAGLRGVPAIALTGFSRPGDRQRALDAGFDDHLAKPFQVDAFVAAITRLNIGKHGPRDHSAG